MATTAKMMATKLMETVEAPDLFGVSVGAGDEVPVGPGAGVAVGVAQTTPGGRMKAGP